MKLCLLLVAAVLCASVAQADVPLSFHAVTPNSAEIHWQLPVKVAGLQMKLGNRDHFTYTNVVQGPALPSSWSASSSLTTGAIVAFSLSGIEANNDGSNDGKVFDIQYEPTLGTLELESCLVTDKQGSEVECTLPAAAEIPAPPLEFEVTAISSEAVTLGYTLQNWPKVAHMEFEVDGMHMATFQTSYDITCSKSGNRGQMVCTGTDIPVGHDDNLIEFTLTPNSGGRSFELINTEFNSERSQLEFDVTLPGKAYVPKITVGIESIEVVDASSETCGSGSEMCAKQMNEVRVFYKNHDTAVLIAGFEFTLQGSNVVWLDSSLAEGLHGFSLSGNDNGKFVCFSMQGSEIPASAPSGSTLFVAHIDNHLKDSPLTLTDVVLSDTSGNAIASIVHNGGAGVIPGCYSGDDLENGYCDKEDFDCDCCLNEDDEEPTNALAGCGFCSDLDDTAYVDIVDVIRTINGWSNPGDLSGDANGSGDVDSADVLIAVNLALDEPEDQVLKNRPCGQEE